MNNACEIWKINICVGPLGHWQVSTALFQIQVNLHPGIGGGTFCG